MRLERHDRIVERPLRGLSPGAARPVTCLTTIAIRSIVPARKTVEIGSLTPNSASILASRRIAMSEWPPSWKKSSWTPRPATPSTSCQIDASRSSTASRGETWSGLAVGLPRARCRQGRAVELAVGDQGQGAQARECGRDHVARARSARR